MNSSNEKPSLAGIWLFIGADLLLFGVLIGACAAWRHAHPAPFQFAATAFSPILGAAGVFNLLFTALLAALAAFAAQQAKRKITLVLLALVFIQGVGFVGVRGFEYFLLAKNHLGFGAASNVYSSSADFIAANPTLKPAVSSPGAFTPTTQPAVVAPIAESKPIPGFVDPNANTPDAAKIVPAFAPISTRLLDEPKPDVTQLTYSKLSPADQPRVFTAFQWFYCLSGLHLLHILVGLPLILWLMPSGRSPNAVQSVALYWQLLVIVGLFLFPLIFSLHG